VKKNLLIICRIFPPLTPVGGKRIYFFSKYLSSYGWEPYIVTSPIPRNAPVDPSFDIAKLKIERYYCPKWWPQPHVKYPMFSFFNRTKKGSGRIFLLALYKFLQIPFGKELVLIPFVLFRLIRKCKRDKIDLVYASSGPPLTLFYGYLIALFTNLPLVVEFRDPWTLNYLQLSKPFWIQYVERYIERIIVRKANRLIFTSEITCKKYQAIYSKILPSRMSFIYSGYDTSVKLKIKPEISIFYSIVHFGNCFGSRSLKPLLIAIKQLEKENLLPICGIKLISYGYMCDEDINYSNEICLNKIIINHKPINYTDGIAKMANADLLLLLGYGNEEGYIPAKIFDYFLVNKPILCITKCSELMGIVQKYKQGMVASPHNIDEIKRLLLYAFKSKGKKYRDPLELQMAPFTIEKSVRELSDVLNSVL
jgi:hypothetical protein